MADIRIDHDALIVGQRFVVDFQRTLRIPDDGGTYPLPPGLGRFPVCRVEDYAGRVPTTWLDHGGVFISMYQREALWLNFAHDTWPPRAVKVAVGKVNAVTGSPWDQVLHADPQDYLVCPDQPWLDGINAGDGYIRQFVAMPLGMGYTVEAQVSGKEEWGGLQLVVFDPRPGKFPAEPSRSSLEDTATLCCLSASVGMEMGLGAGGRMKQSIYPDNYGIDTWNLEQFSRVYVHIVNSMVFREITGCEPPPTPVSAKMYTEHGLPWFELYDEGQGDLAPSEILKQVQSVKEMDQQKGFAPQQDDAAIEVPVGQIKKLGKDPKRVDDGNW